MEIGKSWRLTGQPAWPKEPDPIFSKNMSQNKNKKTLENKSKADFQSHAHNTPHTKILLQ